MKLFRNNVHSKNVLVNEEIVSYKHIKDLFYEDADKVPRLAPGLTSKAVTLPAFSKMNVKTAVKTFSRTTSKALICYVEMGSMSKDCLPTASFIEKIDGLFDCFNSRQRNDKVKVCFSFKSCMISFMCL